MIVSLLAQCCSWAGESGRRFTRRQVDMIRGGELIIREGNERRAPVKFSQPPVETTSEAPPRPPIVPLMGDVTPAESHLDTMLRHFGRTMCWSSSTGMERDCNEFDGWKPSQQGGEGKSSWSMGRSSRFAAFDPVGYGKFLLISFHLLTIFFLSFSFERLKSWNQSWVDLAREGGEGRFFSGDWQTSMLDACQENGRFCPISMVRYIFLLAWLCSLVVVVAVALPLRSMPSSYCLSSFFLSFFLSWGASLWMCVTVARINGKAVRMLIRIDWSWLIRPSGRIGGYRCQTEIRAGMVGDRCVRRRARRSLDSSESGSRNKPRLHLRHGDGATCFNSWVSVSFRDWFGGGGFVFVLFHWLRFIDKRFATKQT